jgi:hypothetical protein
MKKVSFLIIALFTISISSNAQSLDDQYLSKVQTLDSTIETLYGVISGDKGLERDWDLFTYLFHPDANLIPSGESQPGLQGNRF